MALSVTIRHRCGVNPRTEHDEDSNSTRRRTMSSYPRRFTKRQRRALFCIGLTAAVASIHGDNDSTTTASAALLLSYHPVRNAGVHTTRSFVSTSSPLSVVSSEEARRSSSSTFGRYGSALYSDDDDDDDTSSSQMPAGGSGRNHRHKRRGGGGRKRNFNPLSRIRGARRKQDTKGMGGGHANKMSLHATTMSSSDLVTTNRNAGFGHFLVDAMEGLVDAFHHHQSTTGGGSAAVYQGQQHELQEETNRYPQAFGTASLPTSSRSIATTTTTMTTSTTATTIPQERGGARVTTTTPRNNKKTQESPQPLLPSGGGRRHLSRFIENALKTRLQRWSHHTRNLQVSARARPLALFQGALGSDIRIAFDRIAFHNIQISGGGVLDVNKIAFDLFTLAPPWLRKKKNTNKAQQQSTTTTTTTTTTSESSNSRRKGVVKKRGRFAQPFEFHFQNFVFLQEDIVRSSCIRNGLQRLFNRILNKSGFLKSSRVTVTSVDVLPQDKLSCRCVATTHHGTQVPFEVRTGLDVTGDGHVLTFPGMEVAIGNPTSPIVGGLFVPVLPEIHLDIGHNAKIDDVEFRGQRKQIRVDARVTVTPQKKQAVVVQQQQQQQEQQQRQKQQERKKQQQQQKLVLLGGRQYRQSPSSYRAHYACDLGMWVTNLGNFTK